MKANMEQFPAKNPNPVLSTTKDGTVLYSNEAGEPLLYEWGIEVGDKLPSYIEDLVQEVISKSNTKNIEVKAGKRTYLVAFHPLPDEESVNIYGFDISCQKEYEEKLRESEEKYRNIIETAIEGIWILDAEFRTSYVNKKMAEILGYNQEEMIDRFPWDFANEEGKNIIKLNMEKRRQYISDILEIKFIRSDGSPLWAQVSSKSLFDKNGRFTGVLGMLTDITERKRAEEALAFERSQLLSIFDGMDDVVYVTDPYTYEVLYANKAMKEKFGGELVGGLCYQEFQQKDSPCDFCTNPMILKEREKPYHWEYYNPTIDRFFMIVDRIIKWPDGRDVRLGIAKDITERKQLEEQTRQRAEELETLMDVVPVAIFIGHDPKCHYITGNRMANELYEAKFRENVSANVSHIRRIFHKGIELTADELPMQKAAYENIDVRNEELDWLLPSGDRRVVLGSASPLHDAERNVRGSIGAFIDITERKQMEDNLKKAHNSLEVKVKERTAELEKAYNSLKESEKRLAEAQEMAHIGNWEWDITTDKTYWSEEMYRIFKRDPQKSAPSLKEYYSYIHPDDLDYYCNATDYTRKVSPSGFDFRIVLANGEERTLHLKSDFIFNNENNPIRVKGIVQDITESKKAEEKIRYLANIVESSLDAIGTISLDGIITSWNRGAERIYGYSAEEILGKHVSILSPSHLYKETMKLIELIKQGESYHQYETQRLGKDGNIIYVSITYSPVFDYNGKLTAISIIGRDITERKETEEALKNFEITRRKEIHHRIKNNLQVISSLLDLQADLFKGRENIKDSEVLKAFKESIDRVLSISLIHEELYKGKNIDVFDFSQYIKELAENLLLTYSLKTEVSLNFDLEEDIFLDMDTAIPLGIAINEIVTNSFKYAFSGSDKGEISIKLHREENEECKSEGYKSTNFLLSISDNGVGIPKHLDIEDLNSLGLQLVTTLVDQLDGELELKRDNGTEFIIRFTIPERDNPSAETVPRIVDND